MALTPLPRLLRAAASIGVAALVLAGCGDGADTTFSPTASASASPEPSPLTGTTEVESMAGTITAEVPAAWEEYPAETAEQAMLDPAVVDVLGLWNAGATPEDPHSVVIMSQALEDPEMDAQGYYDTYFAGEEDPAIEVSHEIFTSQADQEVLFVDLAVESAVGVAEESVFFVFGEETMVVGLLSASSQMDPQQRDALRDVATSLEVSPS